MSVQVSYKKQILTFILLLIVFLTIVEIIVNIWLYNFYKCDFEDNEIFKDLSSETKRQICLESLGHDFVKQNVNWENGTRKGKQFGGFDESIVYFNSEGFRGPEFTKEKSENTFRILITGGSTTFGVGVFDNQTFPYYLQELYDQTNLGYKVEVINVGWPGWNSVHETEKIKTKMLEYEPDLIMVFDGWNDMAEQNRKNPEYSPMQWKERWMEICELGKQHNFDTVIALQAMVGTGNKILSYQEHQSFMLTVMKKILPMYPTYVEQLDELKNHCSETLDMTKIFDHIQEPIFYDQGHVGSKGNEIIAENFYQISLPLVIEASKRVDLTENVYADSVEKIDSKLIANDFDAFVEKSYLVLRDIIALYKTPKVFPLIFQE